MSTVRPYQRPTMRATAFEILRERAGTFYDPMLLANFITIVGGADALVRPAAQQRG